MPVGAAVPVGAPPPGSQSPGRRVRRGADARVVLTLVWLGAAATVALWWQSTPSVGGLGEWLTDAGRITGLLAGYAMAVLVLLMARLPPLERGVGADRLARWHAMGGRYAVSLVMAHALLITWGYAVTSRTGLFEQTSSLLLTYPDVLSATVAGLLLVGVGVASARAARRRLRYETWYFLHFYTYIALWLSFGHQIATGAQFLGRPLSTFFWTALYVGTGAAVLWWRVAVPAVQALRHRLHVVAVRREGPDTVSVLIGGRDLDALAAEPGQFFRWRFLTRDLWWSSNPYSMSAPASRFLRITVRESGDASRALHTLRPGTRVVAEGPYGAMHAGRRTRRKVLLVAGGLGIAPLRALLEGLPAEPGDLTLVYRAGDPTGVVLHAEIDDLAHRRGARVHYLVGRRSQLGYDPLHPDHLRALVPDLRDHDVYVCGPPGMQDAVRTSLRAAGVPRARVHVEDFTL